MTNYQVQLRDDLFNYNIEKIEKIIQVEKNSGVFLYFFKGHAGFFKKCISEDPERKIKLQKIINLAIEKGLINSKSYLINYF